VCHIKPCSCTFSSELLDEVNDTPDSNIIFLQDLAKILEADNTPVGKLIFSCFLEIEYYQMYTISTTLFFNA
jgi:hypothetical protein